VDRGQAYELVDRKCDIAPYLAVAFPIMFGALIWLLGTSATAARPRPWEDSTIMTVVIVWFLVFEVQVFWHRARVRATRLVIDDGGLTLKRGEKQLWRVAWANIASVRLRKYTLRHSYFHEALIIEPAYGKTRVVPTASTGYGQMPSLDDLLHRIESKGLVVHHDRRPTWITV